MRNLNTEKCNAVYELMRIMSGTKYFMRFIWIHLITLNVSKTHNSRVLKLNIPHSFTEMAINEDLSKLLFHSLINIISGAEYFERK